MKKYLILILIALILLGCATADTLAQVETSSNTALYSVQAVWQYGNVIYAVKIRDNLAGRTCYVPASGSGIACYDDQEISWAP